MKRELRLLKQDGTWSEWAYGDVQLKNIPADPANGLSQPGVYRFDQKPGLIWLGSTLETAMAVLDQQLTEQEGLTPDLQAALASFDGLCTSITKTDEQNATIVRFILDAYLQGEHLQASHRADSLWHNLLDLPQDFVSFRFRKLQ